MQCHELVYIGSGRGRYRYLLLPETKCSLSFYEFQLIMQNEPTNMLANSNQERRMEKPNFSFFFKFPPIIAAKLVGLIVQYR